MYSEDWEQTLTLKNKMSFPTIQDELVMFFKLNHLKFHLDPWKEQA